MKIAYVLGEYPSLSETFIAREIEALRRRGFEIDVWALQAGEGARQIPVSSVARGLSKLRGASEQHWIKVGVDWARRERDRLRGVRHIHAGWASFPAAIAHGAAGVLGVPWSFSGHARDLWVDGENLPEKLRAAKFAAVCTRSGAEYLQSCAPEQAGRVLYAPHGIEISKYQSKTNRALHDPIHVLAVGRLVEKKGFSILLLALSELAEKGYAIDGAILGEGAQRRELEKQIAGFKWDNAFRLRGACSHEAVIAAMQQSDIFVMPSIEARDGDRDGLPNVLLEAAACGLPIVATRAGAIEDFLDESCAWLCEASDPVALAATIQSAITRYDESLQRAQNARLRVVENFDIEKNIELLARAFEA